MMFVRTASARRFASFVVVVVVVLVVVDLLPPTSGSSTSNARVHVCTQARQSITCTACEANNTDDADDDEINCRTSQIGRLQLFMHTLSNKRLLLAHAQQQQQQQ